jgi:hypothetical protein
MYYLAAVIMRVYMIGCDCMYSDQARSTAACGHTSFIVHLRVPPSNASLPLWSLLESVLLPASPPPSLCHSRSGSRSRCQPAFALLRRRYGRLAKSCCHWSRASPAVVNRTRVAICQAKDEDVEAQNKIIVSPTPYHTLFFYFKCPSTTGRVARCVAYMFRSRRA